MTEIDILNECNHKNVIKLFNAYYFDSTLWVSIVFYIDFLASIFII
jgi:hypothetical protein